MDTRELIKKLVSGGLTETEIGRRSNISQATINRISTGEVSDPKHSTWVAVKKIHDDIFIPKEEAA